MTAQFFGFGSLVNTETHSYDGTPSMLYGWRREWVATPFRDQVFLSVRRDPDTTIEGILAAVPNGDWVALDQREAGYTRKGATSDIPNSLAICVIGFDQTSS